MNHQPSPLQESIKNSIEVSIRLVILSILIGWCLLLIFPFLSPVIWGIVIAVSISPLYNLVNHWLNDRPKTTSIIIILIFLGILIVPAYFLINSIIDNLLELGSKIQEKGFSIPPPTEKVKSWPLIGNKAFELWTSFSQNFQREIVKYDAQMAQLGKWLFNSVMSITGDIAKLFISIIIAGILLATKGTKELTRKFFRKLVGERGNEFASLTEKTISNVTKGVLGVAFIQAAILGIIFLLAGVPYAGIWALICLILGVIQLPPSIVSIGVIVYLYSTMNPTGATVWAVIILLAGFSDNILKPILLGKGAPVPMLVIFIGSLGGFIMSGFLGLFTGAIILSLGYKLLMAWINEDEKETEIN